MSSPNQIHSVPTLETERLLLRPFRDSDIDAYAVMCADPEVMRYIGTRSVLSRDDAWRQLAMLVGHWQLRGFGMWAVEERASRALVGRVGLHFPEGWHRAISLIDPDNRRFIRLAERLGERFEREVTVRGHSVSLYAIERDSWSAG